ncbi:MAG: hypothetical protein MZV64_04145 [Ignavibacteriales bacterium]|nr:hypothetical protein [Ignavibacteriales bacterium]
MQPSGRRPGRDRSAETTPRSSWSSSLAVASPRPGLCAALYSFPLQAEEDVRPTSHQHLY